MIINSDLIGKLAVTEQGEKVKIHSDPFVIDSVVWICVHHLDTNQIAIVKLYTLTLVFA